MSAKRGTTVIGLGNIILSDDGLGVHAIRRLRERRAVGEDVELIEGGTAGLLLLPHLADARRAILVDAIDSGASPGTLTRLNGSDWMSAFSIRMTPHEVALEDLLGAAQLIGAWPEELVVLGVQPGCIALGSELSAPVAAALDSLVDAIAAELTGWELPPPDAPRAPGRPNLQVWFPADAAASFAPNSRLTPPEAETA